MNKKYLLVDRFLFELWSRERNIVFPDTVRNEGIFYRNLARRDQSRDPVQRVGTMMLAACFLLGGCFFLAAGIGILVSEGLSALIPAITFFGTALVAFAIGGKLAIAAVFVTASSNGPLHPEIINRRRISGRR